MRWIMPEIEGKKRWEVEPCAISIDEGESLEEVALDIVRAAIQEAKPVRLGLIPAFFSATSGKELPSAEDLEAFRAEFQNHGRMGIDYWHGRQVKLSLAVADPATLHISLNTWTDRIVDEAAGNVPVEAVDELQHVLEVAIGKVPANSSEDKLLQGFVENELGPKIMTGLIKREGQLFGRDWPRHRARSPQEREEIKQLNIKKSRAASRMKNKYLNLLAKEIMAKYNCPRKGLKIKILAPSWLPEEVNKKKWRAEVKVLLPDGTVLPSFTVDSDCNGNY